MPASTVAIDGVDAYVEEFSYDPNDPPVVGGVQVLSESEMADYREKIERAEEAGPPQERVVPGRMWSDKVGVPRGVTKAEADSSEVALAQDLSRSQARGFGASDSCNLRR